MGYSNCGPNVMLVSQKARLFTDDMSFGLLFQLTASLAVHFTKVNVVFNSPERSLEYVRRPE